MKRRHNRKQIIDFCQQARQIRPQITFGADIIAGFPTETPEALTSWDTYKRISLLDTTYPHANTTYPNAGTTYHHAGTTYPNAGTT